MFRFPWKRKYIASLLSVIILTILISLTAGERESITRAEGIVLDFLAPGQRVLTQVSGTVGGAVGNLVRFWQLEAENRALKEELKEYAQLKSQVTELREENQRLRALLDFVQRNPYEFISAEVVARSPDNWFREVVINRGTHHGIRKDMVVVTSAGLVGRVSAVAPRTAKVMLITDAESGVGALVQRSRDAGVVFGQAGGGGRLLMRFFSPEAAPLVGDTIVSSGLGPVYPEGIFIGQVVAVKGDKYAQTNYAEVKPAVDFNRLEEVLVMKKPRSEAAASFLEGGQRP